MTTRIGHAQYRRPSGGLISLAIDKYENEPDFQSYAIARFVDPHDPSVAAFAGFDIRSELVDLLHGEFADESSAAFEEAKVSLLTQFDIGEAV